MSNNQVPLKIWQCWFQGLSTNIPFINYTGINKWKSLNPECEHILVDNSTLDLHAPEYNKIIADTKYERSYAAKSDLLRILLLSRHGGVWADASTVPLTSVKQILSKTNNESGLFGYQFEKIKFNPKRGSRLLSSWFLCASPNNYIINKWRDIYIDRFINYEKYRYFEFHDSLVTLLEHDPTASEQIQNIPLHDSFGPHSQLQPLRQRSYRRQAKTLNEKNILEIFLLKRPTLEVMPLILTNKLPSLHPDKLKIIYKKNKNLFKAYISISLRLSAEALNRNTKKYSKKLCAGSNTETLIKVSEEIGNALDLDSIN